MKTDKLIVGMAQIAPIWLLRDHTIEKINTYIAEAARKNCELLVFSEALLPGYPFWIERTDGARFESDIQKEIFAWYMSQAICIEAGDLNPICQQVAKSGINIYLGIIERPADRGGHSLYCSLVYIHSSGKILSIHRKLVPTYEERLCWSPGDGHGLTVHKCGPFTVGGLNCWENWMPLARTTLYAKGEDLHVAVWPGSAHNTHDITRFIARESRSYVISCSGILKRSDIPSAIPLAEYIQAQSEDLIADGGSCIAGPDGKWIVEPITEKEQLIIATLDHRMIRRERQNMDQGGHYSRPDVLKLNINFDRQGTLNKRS
jgi:nitrilase